jgi:4-hydroxy-3-methylbut-2-en-1-yl diphosphate reductase
VSHVDIRVSEFAGYCWGVERALTMTQEAARNARHPVQTLGPLIHNPAVIAQLATQGVDVIERPAEAAGGTVIIRSHGVSREIMEELAAGRSMVVDATCTFVKAAQEKAARLRDAGYQVVILGEPDHAEVLGIRSHAGPEALVVEGPEDLPDDLPHGRIGLVVQTTQPHERLSALAAALAPRARELLVYNTICNATEQRQSAAVAMAREVDVVIVVGGRNSGNTTRLVELCAAVQPRTHHVEAADEIRPEWMTDTSSVGVTAGASTPSDQIQAVVERLRETAA